MTTDPDHLEVGQLAEAVTALAAQVTVLENRANRRAGRPQPRDWTGFDAEQAAAAWEQLTGFTHQLRHEYGLAETIPACWWAHPPIRDELDALFVAWLGAYDDPDATSDAGVHWLHQLDLVTARIRAWDRLGCASRGHTSSAPSRDTPDEVLDRDAFVAADIASRPLAPDGVDDPGPMVPRSRCGSPENAPRPEPPPSTPSSQDPDSA